MLAFALIHMELDCLSVSAMEGLVFIEDGLNEVIASGDGAEAADGITECSAVDGNGLARLPSVNVHPEDDLSAGCVVDLIARLVAGIGGENEQEAAI